MKKVPNNERDTVLLAAETIREALTKAGFLEVQILDDEMARDLGSHAHYFLGASGQDGTPISIAVSRTE